MFGLTALELARIQFGFTISAHIIFPATTNLFAAKPFAAAILIKCLEAALEGHRGEANT
jgi:cytochrome bd-type quinol oxidase subunit 1